MIWKIAAAVAILVLTALVANLPKHGPVVLTTIPPAAEGVCSADGGKHWFPARTNGACYIEDRQ